MKLQQGEGIMLKKLLVVLMIILYTFNFTACIYSDNTVNKGEPTKNIRYAVDFLPQGFAYSREDIYFYPNVYSMIFTDEKLFFLDV